MKRRVTTEALWLHNACPQQRPSQTCRPSCTGQADLAAVEFGYPAARRFKSRPRDRVTACHDETSRRSRQNIASQRFVFLLRDVHKLNAMRREQFEQRYGQKAAINNRKIIIQQTDEGHQMKDILRTVPVWKLEGTDLHASGLQ